MSIEIIKSDLPNMPEEVIDIWLLTHFKRFGWPPTLDNEWKYIWQPPRTLDYLQKMFWQERGLHITPKNLAPHHLQVVMDLFRTHVLKHETIYSMTMSDSLERFNSCVAYLKKHGIFPRPVVLESTPNGYDILDGNHRITAYFYLYGFFNVHDSEIPNLQVSAEQPVWIGKLQSK